MHPKVLYIWSAWFFSIHLPKPLQLHVGFGPCKKQSRKHEEKCELWGGTSGKI